MKRNKAKELIEKLSSENERWLKYTKEAHMHGIFSIIKRIRVEKKKDFILELIQNADDCNSSEISFNLVSSKIIIQNNGNPFESNPDRTKDDIFAICKLGQTTKESGKIGFMGFGFRSVFEVSKKPEIYSNNFSFYFDENMIIPHWIENIPKDIKKILNKMKRKGSIFVLPNLKKEIKNDIKQALKNLSPTLLLYLQHLKRIRIGKEIIQKNPGPFLKSFWVSRGDEERNLWKIYNSEPLLIPNELREFLKKDRKLDRIGKEPKEYEQISITFEITPNGSILDKQNGSLYAFLPLADEMNSRFIFNIQADFSVDASRRKLRESEGSWNKWILTNVNKCFPSLLKDYKKGKRTIRTEFYKILPLDDPERPKYLNIVKEKIDEYIKKEDSILVKTRKSKKYPDGNRWVKPEYAVIAKPDIQKLFDGMDLKHLFGVRKYYIADDEIDDEGDDEGMRYIEEIVENKLSFDEIIRLLKDSRWIFDRKIKKSKYPEKWIGNLIIYFANESDIKSYLSRSNFMRKFLDIDKKTWLSRSNYMRKLLDIKFILTENGKLGKLQKTFLPPSEDIDIPSHLRRKYRIVNSKLVHYLEARWIKDKKEKERRERGLDLIQKILPKLTPETIVEEIINPAFYNDDWKKYSDSTLIKYTEFIRKNEDCWKYADIILKVQSNVKERIYKKPSELYLSSKYGNDFDLDTLYKNYKNEKFISLDYIKKIIKSKSDIEKQKIKSWKKFLIKIGLKEIIEIKKYSEIIYYKEEIEKLIAYPEDEIKDTYWSSKYPSYEKIDYNFDESIEEILLNCCNDKVKNSYKKLKILIKMLDRRWDYYSKYLEAEYGWHAKNQSGLTYERLCPSSFSKFLREYNWIPTKDGKHLKPEALAINELKDIVKIPIIDYKITNNKFKQYLEKLGLQIKPTIEGAIAHLKAMVEQDERKKNKFKEVYKHLAKHSTEKKKIKEMLKELPCIYIPRSKNKYWRISDVCWRKGEVFLEWKKSIEKVYPDLKEFFIKILGVKEKPDHWDYVEFLKSYLWEKDDLSSKEKSSLKDVYHNLYVIVTTPELKESDQWIKMKEDFKVFCEGGYWKTIRDEDIYYQYDDEIYRLFRNEDINFAYIPKNKNSHEVRGLFEELGIKSLSDNFREKCSTFGKQVPVSEEYAKQIRRTSKYITHFVKYKAPKKFRELNKRGAFKRLSNVSVKTVEILSVEACIGEYIVSLEKRQSFYSWETPENCVYIDENIEKESESYFRYIGIAIANAFVKGIGLELFIPYIFGIDDLNIVKVMQDYRIPIKEKIKIEEKEEVKKESELEKEEKEFIHIGKLSTELKRTKTKLGEKLYIDPKDFISYKIEESTPFIKDVPNGSLKKVVLKKGHKEFDGRKQKPRRRVDRGDAEAIALEIVMRFEESEDREPDDRHKQPGIGYDVYSSTKKKKERFIEVKHFSREATNWEFTSHQWKKAEQEKDKYFVYIVSRLIEGNIPNIWIIQNPVKYLTPDPPVKKIFSNWKNKIVKKITFQKI